MPVYNCEKYLCESINSVLKQTLQEWELLCVDDGSSDSSLDVLQMYQTRDSRIHVYTQSNQGAGVARNYGMRYARGEYIAFLDSDDYFFDADALEQMYTICNMYKVNACGSMIMILRNGVVVEDKGLTEVRKKAKENQILHYNDFQFDYGFYGFIFKNAVIKKHKIMFPPYRRFQDPPFFVRAMMKINNFCFIDKALYCYRSPDVMTRFDTTKTVDLLKGLIDNLDFSACNNLDLLFNRTLQRLEVEYRNIICQNVSMGSTEILELLLRANHIVRRVFQRDEYIIAPLNKIFSSVEETIKSHTQDLYAKISNSDHIFIYGAGTATKEVLMCLYRQGLGKKITAIIVTSIEDNPREISSVPVIPVDDYRNKKGDLILITVTSIYQEEIVKKLQEIKVKNYAFVDINMLNKEVGRDLL